MVALILNIVSAIGELYNFWSPIHHYHYLPINKTRDKIMRGNCVHGIVHMTMRPAANNYYTFARYLNIVTIQLTASL